MSPQTNLPGELFGLAYNEIQPREAAKALKCWLWMRLLACYRYLKLIVTLHNTNGFSNPPVPDFWRHHRTTGRRLYPPSWWDWVSKYYSGLLAVLLLNGGFLLVYAHIFSIIFQVLWSWIDSQNLLILSHSTIMRCVVSLWFLHLYLCVLWNTPFHHRTWFEYSPPGCGFRLAGANGEASWIPPTTTHTWTFPPQTRHRERGLLYHVSWYKWLLPPFIFSLASFLNFLCCLLPRKRSFPPEQAAMQGKRHMSLLYSPTFHQQIHLGSRGG